MEKLLNWIDARFPLTVLWRTQWGEYVAPKNFNFWYYFGSLAALTMVMQIVTGIFLTMYYKPDATKAFESVEYIMRDVPWGWFIRYLHSTGASLFFAVGSVAAWTFAKTNLAFLVPLMKSGTRVPG